MVDANGMWDGTVHSVSDVHEYMTRRDLNRLMRDAAAMSRAMGAVVTPILHPAQIYTAPERAWFRSSVGSV